MAFWTEQDFSLGKLEINWTRFSSDPRKPILLEFDGDLKNLKNSSWQNELQLRVGN